MFLKHCLENPIFSHDSYEDFSSYQEFLQKVRELTNKIESLGKAFNPYVKIY
jgi:hypothetical protein